MESSMKELLAGGLLALSLLGCATEQRGRVMADTDQDYVGNRGAGAETFDRLISGAAEKLLMGRSAANSGVGPIKVVVLPVENKTIEELMDWQDQIYALIATTINRSERYQMISDRFVNAALREARLRPDELFVPAKRREFIAILESQGQPVDALLYPELTTGTTSAQGGITQRNYNLRLELIDVATGTSEQVSERLRKEYQP
jgi:hypothetical protein